MQKLLISLLLSFLLSVSVKSQVNGSFIFDGISRSWIVYLPQNYNTGDSFPLLLALHGLTQTGQAMMNFSGFNSIADTGNFIVAYPNGVGNAWNVGFSGGSTADDAGFISALIDTLHQNYNINLNRVYATGFSNGGFLSYRLACELGGRIAAIAPVAGTMTDGAYNLCSPERQMPVLHIHGTSDFVVSYNGGFGNKSVDQVLGFWNNYNNCPGIPLVEDLPDLVAEGSTVKRYSWSPCDKSSEAMLLKIIYGGHTWPGSVGVTGIGITNRDISASGEIWKFVSRFSLEPTTGVKQMYPDKILVYPNPASGNLLVIESPGFLPGSVISIIASDGKVVIARVIKQNSSRIVTDITELIPGFYLAMITGSGKRIVTKFVIQ